MGQWYVLWGGGLHMTSHWSIYLLILTASWCHCCCGHLLCCLDLMMALALLKVFTLLYKSDQQHVLLLTRCIFPRLCTCRCCVAVFSQQPPRHLSAPSPIHPVQLAPMACQALSTNTLTVRPPCLSSYCDAWFVRGWKAGQCVVTEQYRLQWVLYKLCIQNQNVDSLLWDSVCVCVHACARVRACVCMREISCMKNAAIWLGVCHLAGTSAVSCMICSLWYSDGVRDMVTCCNLFLIVFKCELWFLMFTLRQGWCLLSLSAFCLQD